MSNLRTFATIGFTPDDPPDLPFDVRVQLRGSGAGRVTGEGKDGDGAPWRIDCGTKCTAAQIQIQSDIVLRAERQEGSRFVRWLGICSTDPVCRFSAGAQAVVGAQFEPVAPPPPPPPPRPPPPPPPPTPPPAATFAPKVTKLAVAGRVVKVRVVLDRPARATLGLLRGKKTLATRRFSLAAGRTDVRFGLPPRLAGGWYRMTGTFVGTRGETARVDRPFRLRR
jgi:hypothetical protein